MVGRGPSGVAFLVAPPGFFVRRVADAAAPDRHVPDLVGLAVSVKTVLPAC
jgi:hypothetical protein